ncbi:MAG: bifunctional diaminohydroxyphosphoribosylaminopyrimidine deaminase/5-amino-6-(5-phosphoribosylamino)uracil reductase RibD, partial [Akkermansiaceae bacterium]
MMKISEDEKWIRVALEEGRKGIGLTAPNPPVGAVLVKDGAELARGWHRRAGTPHAERDALSKISEHEAKGATAYVTLEPCSTQGRTGACTEALIAAGVAKVVYGA